MWHPGFWEFWQAFVANARLRTLELDEERAEHVARRDRRRAARRARWAARRSPRPVDDRPEGRPGWMERPGADAETGLEAGERRVGDG